MFDTSISLRMYAITTALAAVGILVHLPASVTPIAPAITAPSAPALQPAALPTSVMEAAPRFDVARKLWEIGARAQAQLAETAPTDSPTRIPAAGACERLTAMQQTQLRSRLAAWIDQTYSDEKRGAKIELEFRSGCVEPDGLVVDMNVDRTRKAGGRLSRWWIVRVTTGDIAILAERTSEAKIDWMEWSNMGTISVLALVDLDRDGVREVVWTRTDKEGGAR